MDRPEPSTVTGSHVLVERLDGIHTGELTELFVHVVCARAGVVAEPDTEVLHLQRLLLVDLAGRKENLGQYSHTACLLGATGRSTVGGRGEGGTNDVDADDLAGGLLDLLELAGEGVSEGR